MIKLLLPLFLLCGLSAGAQSFFKPVPPITRPPNRFTRSLVFDSVSTGLKDSTLNAFRPITGIVAYGTPGNILMAGAGISYQHLKWNREVQRWNCEWSVSAMGWAGGSVAPRTPTEIVSYGIMFGVFNNLVMIGPAINGSKVIAVISIGINLNN